MANEWGELGWGPWPVDGRIPGTPPDEGRGLPRTLRPVSGEGVVQRPVFDPALKHYPHAMRAGDPEFADRETAARWYAARAVAFDRVLSAIAGSSYAGHLMLRGSVLLSAWFGARARPPGDLDFVVVPRSWKLEDGRTGRMFDEVAGLAEEASRQDGPGSVRFSASGAVSDEIWTYDRVPGRRLVLPWRAEGLPAGTVQLDFVFGEPLPLPPEPAEIPRPGGGDPLVLLAATPELSLAWKLMWLLSDMYPQAKDLYDAILLAEVAEPDVRMLREMCVAGDPYFERNPPTLEALAAAFREVDRDEFRKEHPAFSPSLDAGAERLLARLAAPFAG